MSACTNPILYIPWARAAKFSSSGGARLTKPTPLGCRNPAPRHPSLAGARAATVQAAAHSVAPRPSAASRAPPPLRRHRSEDAELRAAGEVSSAANRCAVPRREPPCREVRRRQSCARRAAATPAPPPRSRWLAGPIGPGRPPLELFFFFFVN